jgi:hypothetical protein
MLTLLLRGCSRENIPASLSNRTKRRTNGEPAKSPKPPSHRRHEVSISLSLSLSLSLSRWPLRKRSEMRARSIRRPIDRAIPADSKKSTAREIASPPSSSFSLPPSRPPPRAHRAGGGLLIALSMESNRLGRANVQIKSRRGIPRVSNDSAD